MSRRKLSEYRAKTIVCETLSVPYIGWSLVGNEMKDIGDSVIEGCDSYVVKVDQAIKGRFKKGLVALDVKQKELKATIEKMKEKGYSSFLVEPYVAHGIDSERYLSVFYDKHGFWLSCSNHGGVDIESHANTIKTYCLDGMPDWDNIANTTGISAKKLEALIAAFTKQYFVSLEINPYIVDGVSINVLDSAVEVDDAGAYFVDVWDDKDIRTPNIASSISSENVVRMLDAKSPASFNLNVLNKDGSVFLLLSGGGASVVIADEVYNGGLGGKLANYGEYSGNPSAHETYLYTVEIIKLLLASKATKKVLFIGGAVANFTDIANTFAGIIKAIDEYAHKLTKQDMKVYVRRGGPRQEIGLEKIRSALERHQLLGGVYDPSTSITAALNIAIEELK